MNSLWMAAILSAGLAAPTASAGAPRPASAFSSPASPPQAGPTREAPLSPSPTTTLSLEAALKREIALLESEKAALEASLAKVSSERSARGTTLRKDTAELEASLVAQRAQNDGLAAQVQELERAAAVEPALWEPAVASIRSGLRRTGIEDLPDDIGGLLDRGLLLLERGHQVRRHESGFFAADGTYVEGTIISIGHVAAVGSSASAAGALFRDGLDGPAQVVEAGEPDLARGFVDGNVNTAPLLLARKPVGTEEDAPGFIEQLRLAGGPGLAVLLLGIVLLLAVAARVVLLSRALRSTTRTLSLATDLVERGEMGAAEALCRAVIGPAGVLWANLVAMTSRRVIEDVEESAADSLLDSRGRLNRMDHVFTAGGLLLVAAGAFGAVGSAGRSLWALEHALVLLVPFIVLAAAARIQGDALKREMERGALRLIDAARRARVGSP